MPLANDVFLSDVGGIEQHKRVLAEFANKIGSCIDDAEWEMLTATLESRQAYLNHLFTDSVPQNCREAMKLLAESILEQDRLFQARVEEQKSIATKLQLSLERGRRATKAYNNL